MGRRSTMTKTHGKPAKRKKKNLAVMRGCITVLAELCGIAGFLLRLKTIQVRNPCNKYFSLHS
jgi:hypothetical protein